MLVCWAGTAGRFVFSRLCRRFFAGRRQCRQIFFSVSHYPCFPQTLDIEEFLSMRWHLFLPPLVVFLMVHDNLYVYMSVYVRMRRGKSFRRSRCGKKGVDSHVREIPSTRSWWIPMTVKRRSSWRLYHGKAAVWKDTRGTMWKNEYEHNHENVDKQSRTGSEKKWCCSKSSGQQFKNLQCHDESDATLSSSVKCDLATPVNVTKRNGRGTAEVWWLRCR